MLRLDKQKMTKQSIATTLKKYQKSSENKRREFLRAFEEKMIYRTTKTENPQTTHKMVRDVLNKFASKISRDVPREHQPVGKCFNLVLVSWQ